MDSAKQLKEQKPRKRRSKNNQPDPEWTYTPAPLSEHAERFLTSLLEQHPPTVEPGFTVFLHVPILRQILSWVEQPQGGPTEEQRQHAASHEANIHVASHADLLMFGAGTRAERERVFIEIVEGIALLAFAVGGIPRLPQLCEAHEAGALATAFATFKEADDEKKKERQKIGRAAP